MWKLGLSLLPVLALSVTVPGCNDDRAEPVSNQPSAPSWLDELEIEVIEVKPSFEENLEVSLELTNHAKRAFTIEGLGKGELVRLLDDQGKPAPLHRVSVGVAKPIRVRGAATTKTSLLFTPLKGKPAKLRLYDREVPLSQ